MVTALAAVGHLIETHISYVVLTGTRAYKIKKAIRLPFLDFTSLEARRKYCEQELLLNRRLAPSIYLDVVPVTGTVDDPELNGTGPILDYAVRMREFPQSALLSSTLGRRELTPAHVDALARRVANFHLGIPAAAADSPYGDPDDLLRLALDNFDEIRSSTRGALERGEVAELERWTRRQHAALRRILECRRESGFVREGHGDLHLGNMALVDDSITIFDCIDFNDRLRWIDVMNDAAFTVMDLVDRRRPDFANRFLNEYLEVTGDHGGLPLLPFYLVYRAMVRAKVACERAMQLPAGAARGQVLDEYRDHLQLAAGFASARRPGLILMHGYSGSGKTTLARALRERLGAIHLRSDIERKRLHGLRSGARTESAIENGPYSAASTRATYERLLDLALQVTAAGLVALVDAAFLQRWQRDLFRQRAAQEHLRICIVSVRVPEPTLRARVAQRSLRQDDASEANVDVLAHQLRTADPIGTEEAANVVVHDGCTDCADSRLTELSQTLSERLFLGGASIFARSDGGVG